MSKPEASHKFSYLKFLQLIFYLKKAEIALRDDIGLSLVLSYSKISENLSWTKFRLSL